jgi:heme/copper-type cytochrome/quinol oxidase subunit 2
MVLVALAAVDSGPIRLILFILVLVAVILIMVGCIIALLTWRKRQRVYSAYMHAAQWERNKI